MSLLRYGDFQSVRTRDLSWLDGSGNPPAAGSLLTIGMANPLFPDRASWTQDPSLNSVILGGSGTLTYSGGNLLVNGVPVGGSTVGYVLNPMTAALNSGNNNILMAQGNLQFNYPFPMPAPSAYSINGVYNIDSGVLPYPVLRFSSSKAAGTQQKSLVLRMSDGEAIWESAWEGYIPQNITTKQAVYRIAGQGPGAATTIESNYVTIQPTTASSASVNLTGSLVASGVITGDMSRSGIATVPGGLSSSSVIVSFPGVTNSSVILATYHLDNGYSVDATATAVRAVECLTGQFCIHMNALATLPVKVAWFIAKL